MHQPDPFIALPGSMLLASRSPASGEYLPDKIPVMQWQSVATDAQLYDATVKRLYRHCTVLPTSHSPETSGRVVYGSRESPGRLRRQISGQRRDRLVVITRVVGEFHRDWLGRTFRYGSVQFLNCAFRFQTLVKPDESDAFRQAYG